MISDYKQFLMHKKLFPLTSDHHSLWNMFHITHVPPVTEQDMKSIMRMIDEQVGNKMGLYVYKDQNDNIIYVGKGKPLRNRLYSHYKESFMEVPGDTKDKRWHRFFKSKQGKLEVLWCELEGEHNRQIIEKMLDVILQPEFNWSKNKTDTQELRKEPVSLKKARISHNNAQGSKHSYCFYQYGDELVSKVQNILGKDFSPQNNRSGVTFYNSKGRILKLVHKTTKLKVEFNVPVTKVEGLIMLSKEEARAKKMGTCQWIYEGFDLSTVLQLVEEAREKYLGI